MPAQSEILITGFLPFQGEKVNPSQMLATELSKRFGIPSLILPVSYKEAFIPIEKFLETNPAKFCLMLGQAGGRKKVGIERVALNLEDSSLQDEVGDLATDRIIDKDGPLALRSEFDLSLLKNGINANQIEISNSAGTFVCNSLYFRALFAKLISKKFATTEFFFVHVPQLPEQEHTRFLASPGMDFETSLAVISGIIGNLVRK